MKQHPIILILGKDVRRLIWFAVPTGLFAGADRFAVLAQAFGDEPSQLALIIQWPLIFFVSLALGAEDRAVGINAFWPTRPIAATQIALAKWAGIIVLLLAPLGLIELIRALQHDVSIGVAVAIVVERLAVVSVVALLGLLLGISTETLLRAMAVVMAAVVLTTSAVILGVDGWIGMLLRELRDSPVSITSRFVFGVGLFLFCLLGVSVLVFRLRSARTAAIGFFGALTISAVFSNWTDWQIIPEPYDDSVTTEGPPDLDVTVIPYGDLRITRSTGGSNSRATLGLPIHYEWPAPQYAVSQIRKESALHLPDGQQIESATEGRSSLMVGSLLNMLRDQIGLRPHPPVSMDQLKRMDGMQSSRGDALINLSMRVLEQHQSRKVSVETRLLMDLVEAQQLATLPLSEGATWAGGGEILVIQEPTLKNTTGDLEVPILKSRATSLLIPKGIHRPDTPIAGLFYGFALINESRQEVSIAFRFGPNSILAKGTFPIRTLRPRFRFIESLNDPETPPYQNGFNQAWLDGAELLVIITKPAGTHVQDVVFEDLALPRPTIRLEQTGPVLTQ